MKDTNNVSKKIFDFIYNMAVSDATRRVATGEVKNKLEGNEEIKNAIKEYYNGSISFEKTVESINNITKKDEVLCNLSFGKIQKIINMTMKYLYIRDFGNSKKVSFFSQVHAPMDSYMIKFVYDSYCVLSDNDAKPGFKFDCPWSKLKYDALQDKKEYDAFQAAIEYIRENETDCANRIEFDYIYWDVAKSIYDEKLKLPRAEQRKKTAACWGKVI